MSVDAIVEDAVRRDTAVEVATGGLDTEAIERERTARKIRAASILQEFEAEMGISAPPVAGTTTVTPSVGARVGDKTGS